MKAVWDGFCEVLAPIFEGVFQQISNILNEALDILTGLFDIFAGIFTGDWDMVWAGSPRSFRRSLGLRCGNLRELDQHVHLSGGHRSGLVRHRREIRLDEC